MPKGFTNGPFTFVGIALANPFYNTRLAGWAVCYPYLPSGGLFQPGQPPPCSPGS